MRAWFRTLLLLLAAVALAVWLREHGGNVILAVPPWRIQFSTTLAVLALIALFIAGHLGLRLLAWLTGVPLRLRHWRGQRAQQRDHDLLERATVALAAGLYSQAERDLSRLIAQTRVASRKVIAALAAARGAHAQGQEARSQKFLATAQDYMGADPALQRAVVATSAEILLDANQPAEALAQLEAAPDTQHHAQLARLRLRAHEALGQHAPALAQARQLLRRGWLAREAALAAIERAGAEVLRAAATEPRTESHTEPGTHAWAATWKDFKSEERVLARIALTAAQTLSAAGQFEEAARVLEAAIKHQVTPELLAAYAHCDASHVSRRLTRAETWLTQWPDDPDLLCALATLCLTGQIWGTAERYLHRSLQQRPDARTHALLGHLYERLGRAEAARLHWQQVAALSMALPVLAADAALPAADTHADPLLPDAALPTDDTEALSVPEQSTAPLAASAFAQVATPATVTHAGATHTGTTHASAPASQRSNVEDLFDSAPIPGLDTAQDGAPPPDEAAPHASVHAAR